MFERNWQIPHPKSEVMGYGLFLDVDNDGSVLVTASPYTCYRRTFTAGEGRYDHLLVRVGDNQFQRLSVNDPRMAPVEQIFRENGFPHYHDELPDEATLQWHHDLESKISD